MNKKERVLNALNKQPVDHVPCGFWFHFGGAEAKGDACVQAHLKYYRATDLDFLKVMCDGYFAYPIEFEIKKPEDWYQVKAFTKDDPFVKEQVARVKAIVDAIGDERCVFYNIMCPFSAMRNTYDDEFVMECLRENPNAVMFALDRIAETEAILAEELMKTAGATGIYFCVQGGEYDRFTPEEYHKYISPSELYVLEHANRFSDNNILHCCGWAGAKNNLSLWKDYPCKCVNWATAVEEVSLEEGRMLFNNKTVLGGFKTLWDAKKAEGIIYEGNKEELQAYTRELIMNYGKLGLMLGGDCTVTDRIDWDHIRWIVEAARSI